MFNVKCQMRLVLAAVMVLAMTGCQRPRMRETTPGCPGKITIEQAAAALAQQRNRLGPMQATARCVLQWYDLHNKLRSESIDSAQVRFVPPDMLYIRGVKFGEVLFGANESEFWLRIKPELDTYWYGTREQAQQCAYALPMNPANLAEAMGMVEVDARWELFYRDGRDWLTLREQGRPVKRVYVNACDYRVERIEYFDRQGQLTAVTELADYMTANDAPPTPTTIRLTTFYRGQEDSSALFELHNVRRFEPSDKQMRGFFERPGRDGYGTVLQLDVSCNFVEEH